MRKKLFIIFLFLLTAYRLPLTAAFASIGIEPMRIEAEVNAGETYTGHIKIENFAAGKKTIGISAAEYRYMFSQNTVFPKSGPRSLPPCESWIKINPDRMALADYAERSAEFTITVPKGAKGEYAASILVDVEQEPKAIDPAKTGQLSVRVTPRISVPVYVMIKDGMKKSCAIENFKAAQAQNRVQITLDVKNTGTVHLRPVTAVAILDEAKEIAGKINMGRSLPVFPGFGETLLGTAELQYPGAYTAVATVDIGGGELVQKQIEFEVK